MKLNVIIYTIRKVICYTIDILKFLLKDAYNLKSTIYVKHKNFITNRIKCVLVKKKKTRRIVIDTISQIRFLKIHCVFREHQGSRFLKIESFIR